MLEEKQPGPLRRLLSLVWKSITWIRMALANLIFILLIIVVLVVLAPKESFKVPDQTALRLAPNGFLVDQRTYVDPLTQLLEQSKPEEVETLTRDLVYAIEAAAEDKRITTLVLELENLVGGSISKLEEVGQALETFKQSGKPIYALGDNYTQQQYYLATYADEVYMHPMGAVFLTGFSSYRNYFKSALDKLSVNFHVFKVGDYKDFLEPYIRDDMSEASKEQNSLWLSELWNTYTSRVENLRNLPKAAVDDYINNMDKLLSDSEGDSAQLALKSGLVDHLESRSSRRDILMEKLGADEEGKNYQAIDYWDYLGDVNQGKPKKGSKIGLIVAKGAIMDGEQPAGSIGGDTLSKLLKQVEEDKDLKALVLRVDSPGGSAFASEVIRQQMQSVRKAGIPIMVSMGSVAASGGYWISAGADQIWATPTTITGSIGVFGAFPTLEDSLDRLGISTDGVGTTDLAGTLRIDRPLPELAQNIYQLSVDNVYKKFLSLVAEARKTTPEDVHTVAQGRVWSGAKAQELGLVDELGSLQDTIQATADHIGATEYFVEEIQQALDPKEQLIREILGEAQQWLPNAFSSHSMKNLFPTKLREALAPISDWLQITALMNDPGNIYAQCIGCRAP